MKNRPYIVKWIAMLSLFMACCLVSTSLLAQDSGSEEEGAATSDGRKMSREAQVALVEAQRRMTTEPDNFASAREPLIAFLATPQEEPIPETLYLMLGQLWYQDEKNEKHIEEAQKIYKAGYAEYPENENFLYSYAVTAFNLDQFGIAAPLFEKYYEISEKHDINNLQTAAGLYYEAEDIKNAKRVFLKMISLVDKPEQSWFQNVIGICQMQENMDETEKYIWIALEHYPMEKKFWNYLYGVRYANEDIKGAAAALEIAARIEEPSSKSDWQTLIQFYNYASLYIRSANSMRKGFDLLVAESDGKEEMQLAIADYYARAAQTDDAVVYIDSVLAKKPSYNLKLKKAEILYDARRNEAALAALDDCIADNARAYNAYYMKGWIAWDMKDWDAAEKAFDMASASKEDIIRYNSKNCLDMLEDLKDAKNK